MISYINGTLEGILDSRIIVETGGIGYCVIVSNSVIANLPALGGKLKIHTYMQVKEDGISLFGFLTPTDLKAFELLITVTGVGPKAAQGVLSIMDFDKIALAIVTEDIASISKAPGVGKKTAQRIVLELKDKFRTRDSMPVGVVQQQMPSSYGAKQDAIEALIVLGYSQSEATRAVLGVYDDGMTSDTLIKLALKKLFI